MKKVFLTIILSMWMVSTTACGTPVAAQPPTTTETTETSGSEAPPEEETDEPEEESELAPLEEIDLPELRRTDGSNGERQTYLAEGDPAPFAGILLNPEGMAYIISELEAFQLRAGAALRLQRESDWNRLQLETGRLRLRIDTIQRQHTVVVEGLQRENQRLIRIHEEYVEEQEGGFWNTDFGRVLQYGLIIIGAGAVGVVVGFLGASL